MYLKMKVEPDQRVMYPKLWMAAGNLNSNKSEPITDMLFYLDEDDIELLDNLSDIDRLKVFKAVKKMKKFPGYKPEKVDESL